MNEVVTKKKRPNMVSMFVLCYGLLGGYYLFERFLGSSGVRMIKPYDVAEVSIVLIFGLLFFLSSILLFRMKYSGFWVVIIPLFLFAYGLPPLSLLLLLHIVYFNLPKVKEQFK
ncbi:MAG: hypothetical protein WCI77_07705 [Candidatus Omnitrophota bacterium]